MKSIAWILGIIGLFCLMASGVAYTVLKPEEFNWVSITALLGVAGVATWFATYWNALKELGDEQSTMRTAVAVFAAVLGLGITIVVNVAVHRYDQRWDFTKNQRYSLSQQSIDLVSKLDREVEVSAFFVTGSPDETNFRALMEGYEAHSTLLKVSYHDPYSDPLLAEQMKILTDRGTVVLKAGEQTQRLESNFGEESFTNALVRVTSDTFHQVCVVSGHGEMASDDESSPRGLGFARIKLEGQNYRVSDLNLIEKPPTPADCEVVILASPQSDLAPFERDRLARYVAAGGGLVALLDPLQAMDTAADFARYGIVVGKDVVIEGDPNRQIQGADPTYIPLDPASFDMSPITEKLKGVSLLVLARSVGKGPDVAGLNVQVLAHTTDQAWAETKLDDPNIPASPDPGIDIVGTVGLMASVEVTDPSGLQTTSVDPAAGSAGSVVPGLVTPPKAPEASGPAPKSGGKVVVIGDGDFASNQYFTKLTNQDLFLNTVAWMSGEKDQLAIRANDAAKGKLDLSILSLLLSGIASILVVPGLAVVGMAATWMYRRQR